MLQVGAFFVEVAYHLINGCTIDNIANDPECFFDRLT